MTHYDAVILGAGPSGLTAAYCLGKAGARVIVVERGANAGGLMRSIKRGEFVLDLGRKELYTRFPEVDALWHELLGEDYRRYAHRSGVLYGGQVVDKEAKFQGPARGMGLGLQADMGLAFLWAQLKPGSRTANNFEEYYTLRYGKTFYDCFHYGYMRKFEGFEPAKLPAPYGVQEIPRFAFLGNRLSANGAVDERPVESRQMDWRHPAYGTGQLVENLEAGARRFGVEFALNTEVLALNVGDGKARSVTIRRDGVESELGGRSIITSLPIPMLMKMIRPEPPESVQKPPQQETAFKKSTALVYLMATGEPAFPHNWVEVTDMSYKMGRVVNYGTWNCKMVPAGKTALCVEYFCVEGDGIMELSKEDLLKLATAEAERAGLIDPSKIIDSLVLQLPHANAATVIHDWKLDWMVKASAYVRSFEGLLETNRPGLDRAAIAGIDAAKACLAGGPMDPRSLENAKSENAKG